MTVHDALMELSRARAEPSPRARLFGLRTAGERLAEVLRLGPRVELLVLRLGRVLVERALALPALRGPWSFVVLERRAWLVEHAGTRTLVDVAVDDAFTHTPFGERVLSRHPLLGRALGTPSTLAPALRQAGVEASSIDRVVLTSLRFQTLGPLLDTFVRADVVLSRAEHERACLPALAEEAFYERAPPSSHPRLKFIEDDAPGGAVVAFATPGVGGSLSVAAFDGAVRVLSPHGVALDCWTPYESRLPGLRETLRLRDIEALPRGDADPVESAISMGLERTIADRRRDVPAFFEITPSLELVPTLVSPLAPSVASRG